MADSNEGAIDDDWEQLYEEEIMGPCMEDAKGSEYKRPCHRMLVDYPPPGHNKNPKGPWYSSSSSAKNEGTERATHTTKLGSSLREYSYWIVVANDLEILGQFC
jgi:hypothetical protein